MEKEIRHEILDRSKFFNEGKCFLNEIICICGKVFMGHSNSLL